MWPTAGIAACLQIRLQAVYPRMSAEDSDNPSKRSCADVSNPELSPVDCDDTRDVYEHIKDFNRIRFFRLRSVVLRGVFSKKCFKKFFLCLRFRVKEVLF